MLLKKERKTGNVPTVTEEKAARTHRKDAATNAAILNSGLKNSEHGNEQPAR